MVWKIRPEDDDTGRSPNLGKWDGLFTIVVHYSGKFVKFATTEELNYVGGRVSYINYVEVNKTVRDKGKGKMVEQPNSKKIDEAEYLRRLHKPGGVCIKESVVVPRGNTRLKALSQQESQEAQPTAQQGKNKKVREKEKKLEKCQVNRKMTLSPKDQEKAGKSKIPPKPQPPKKALKNGGWMV